MMTTIIATYRLQLNYKYQLNELRQDLNYFKALNISTCYFSPIMKAREKSLHGYDVVNYNLINQEIGGQTALKRVGAQLEKLKMNVLLDVVPNHMAIDKDNTWWQNILKLHAASPFARFFDLTILNNDIHYRRFFDINELVCLNVDKVPVFKEVNKLLANLIKQNWIIGVRVDHIDGIRMPLIYLKMLKKAVKDKKIWLEKVLAFHEYLPAKWPVQGTTGYDFLNIVNQLFIDKAGFQLITKTYNQFVGEFDDIEKIRFKCNLYVISHLFSKELSLLIDKLIIYFADINSPIKAKTLKKILVSMTATLPVYRTYISKGLSSQQDVNVLKDTLKTLHAKQRLNSLELRLLHVIFLPKKAHRCLASWQAFISSWQVFTVSVIAKGFEDTACYRYIPLLSLNEVGSSPAFFNIDRAIYHFHQYNIFKQKAYPQSLNTTSTHDTKRSHDARSFLNVLSELPEEWSKMIKLLHQLNLSKKIHISAQAIPSKKEEYYLYQILFSVWPLNNHIAFQFIDRILIHINKYLREAKEHTNWYHPNLQYEQAVASFCKKVLTNQTFIDTFSKFHNKLAFNGMVNSLTLLLLKTTLPGIPDFYQGDELWQFNLVDPDNRRPIHYQGRKKILAKLLKVKDGGHQAQLIDLFLKWKNGYIKMYLTQKLLSLRHLYSSTFSDGKYIPIRVTGKLSSHIIAYIRSDRTHTILVCALRLTIKMGMKQLPDLSNIWTDELIHLPTKEKYMTSYLTGNKIKLNNNQLPAALIFNRLPLNVYLIH